MTPTVLLGIDWGSSHLRGYRFDAESLVLETRAYPWGVGALPAGGFPAALARLLEGWPVAPMLACGMVGSRHGWIEAPYAELPVDARDLAATLAHVEVPRRGRLSIVPGLHSAAGPDVMRGEETQLVGALALHGDLHASAQIVLPGTHSKWATVRDGRVQAFRTVMTGELYALLRKHSVLGVSMPGNDDGAFHADAFARGVLSARDSGAAGGFSRLFSVRSLWLDGLLPTEAMADYLSGLLIGEELRMAAVLESAETDRPLCLIGAPGLCERYVRAMALIGAPPPRVVDNAAARGLWEIARHAGLLTQVNSNSKGSKV